MEIFLSLTDSKEEKDCKETFYYTLEKEWNFRQQLVDFLKAEVSRLAKESMILLEMSFDIQKALIDNQALPIFDIVSPFSFTNISAFMYALLTNYSLSSLDSVFGIPFCETGVYSGNR